MKRHGAIGGLQDIVDDQLVMALMDGHHAQPLHASGNRNWGWDAGPDPDPP
jgi:hypothetical protein